MNLYKIFKIIAALLGLVGTVLLVMIISKGDDAITAASLEGDTSLMDSIGWVMYIIIGLTIALVLFFVIQNLFTNTKNLKSTLIGGGAFIAILIISYIVSNGSDAGNYFYDGAPATENEAHLVSAGLISFYILMAGAIIAVLLSGFNKITK